MEDELPNENVTYVLTYNIHNICIRFGRGVYNVKQYAVK